MGMGVNDYGSVWWESITMVVYDGLWESMTATVWWDMGVNDNVWWAMGVNDGSVYHYYDGL